MDTTEKKAALLEIFTEDPLWNHIELLGLQEKVFDATLLEDIVLGVDYSTSQVATLLGLKNNQQIINLLNRHDLKDYIQVIQSANGYYAFNHIAIFQLQMILVLREQGLQPLDIASIIGTITQYSKGNNPRKGKPNNLQVRLHEIEDLVESQLQAKLEAILPKLDEELNRFQAYHEKSMEAARLQNKIDMWQIKSESVVSQIALIESQVSIIEGQLQSKPGILSKIFGNKSEESERQLISVKSELEKKKTELLGDKKKLNAEKDKWVEEQKSLNYKEDTAKLNINGEVHIETNAKNASLT